MQIMTSDGIYETSNDKSMLFHAHTTIIQHNLDLLYLLFPKHKYAIFQSNKNICIYIINMRTAFTSSEMICIRTAM